MLSVSFSLRWLSRGVRLWCWLVVWSICPGAHGAAGLSEALDSPDLLWVAQEGEAGGVAVVADDAATGGFRVTLRRGSSLTVPVAEQGMLLIRYVAGQPGVTINGTAVEVVTVWSDPRNFGTDWGTVAALIPPGGGELVVTSPWRTELDFVERVTPPGTLAELLGIDGAVTVGGEAVWQVMADLRRGGYVAGAEVDAKESGGWFEFPVAGPAEVVAEYVGRSSYAVVEFTVDGERVWGSEAVWSDEGVARIGVPAGNHVVRVTGRNPSSYAIVPKITGLRVEPVSGDGGVGQALEVEGPWASYGAWMRDEAFSHDGEDSLRALPPVSPPYPSYRSLNMVQVPVSGPGFVRFMSYVGGPPVEGNYAAIGWSSPVHRNDFRFHQSGQAGWVETELWYPPGSHWLRWSVEGTAEELSRVALDAVSFEASAVLPFDEVVAAAGMTWTNDPVRPWTGVRRTAEVEPEAVSPVLAADEETRISATVAGPGELRFRWKNGATGNMRGELWIHGVQQSHELPWQEEGESVAVPIPVDGPVVVEWAFRARFGGSWAALEGVEWIEWPEVLLAEALDTPDGVEWTTSAEASFKGRPEAGARGGDAAQATLAPGGEAWLEAVVTGAGRFDFWLRDVPGGGNSAREIDWELYIDGVKSHIDPWQTTWREQWVLGAGEHRIRLVFRNASETVSRSIAVDDVSWIPLEAAEGEGLTTGDPAGPFVYADEGNPRPMIILPLETGRVEWLERTVEGPGVLAWSSQMIFGQHRNSVQKVVIDGVCEFPVRLQGSMEINRLHVPSGLHTVRWISEPEIDEGESYPARMDSVWRIGGQEFTDGLSPLMEGIDDDRQIWMETGYGDGVLVTGTDAFDGVDAWRQETGSLLYLCNVLPRGLRASGMARVAMPFGGNDGWEPVSRWAGPSEVVEWVEWVEGSWTLDAFSVREIEVIPLEEALDGIGGVSAEGWVGVKDSEGAFDLEDAGWSEVRETYAKKVITTTVEGPARVKFQWRQSGIGTLALHVDGAWLPVEPPDGEWQEVEFEVMEAATVEWIHRGRQGTRPDAAGEAWVDAVLIEPVPFRSLGEVAAEGGGLTFTTAGEEDAPDSTRWRAAGYRDGSGAWREGVRGITGAAGLKTVVSGPTLLSFRVHCAEVDAPLPVGPQALSVESISPGPGVISRHLWVNVGGKPALLLAGDEARGWREYLVRIPEGEHEVNWRLGASMGRSVGTWVPEWQAWVGEVSHIDPRAHYEAWAALHLDDSAPTEPDDDADGDGSANFFEYAFGADPLDPASRPPEVFGKVRTDHYGYIGGGPVSYFLLHVPRIPAHVSGRLMASEDLRNWTDSGIALRSYLSPTSWIQAWLGEYDLGAHRVNEIRLEESTPMRFYRLILDSP